MEFHYGLAERRGSPERLRSVGIEGPKISVSRMPVRRPRRANASARLTIFSLINAQRLMYDYKYQILLIFLPLPLQKILRSLSLHL